MTSQGSKYEVSHLKNFPNINVCPKNDGKDCKQGSVGSSKHAGLEWYIHRDDYPNAYSMAKNVQLSN